MKTFFESPLKFAEHLLDVAAKQELALHAGLESALKLIKKRAKQKIGHYQGEVGPFQDWAELADYTKEDRVKKGYSENQPLLRDGTLRDSIVHEIGLIDGIVGSKMDIAAFQEFGTPHIPPRPFIGPAAFEKKEEIKALIGFASFSGICGKELYKGTGEVHESLGYNFTTEK